MPPEASVLQEHWSTHTWQVQDPTGGTTGTEGDKVPVAGSLGGWFDPLDVAIRVAYPYIRDA